MDSFICFCETHKNVSRKSDDLLKGEYKYDDLTLMY
jgi:hypothetical protein